MKSKNGTVVDRVPEPEAMASEAAKVGEAPANVERFLSGQNAVRRMLTADGRG